MTSDLRMKRFPRHYVGGLLGPDAAPVHLEVFLSTLCPHSRKAFGEIKSIVEHFDGKVQARINLWIQPWHPQEAILTKAVIAAGLLKRSAGWRLLEQVYNNMDQFSDENVYHRSPADIYDKLSGLVERDGIDRRQFLDAVHSDEVLDRIKWMTHYGRQNGIHFSPSFMLQGFKIYEAESTWTLDKWRTLLDPLMKDIDHYERTRGVEHIREEQHYPSTYRCSLPDTQRETQRERERPFQQQQFGGQPREWSDYGQQQRGYERGREPGVFDKVKEMFTGDTDRERRGVQPTYEQHRGQQPSYEQQKPQDQSVMGKIKDTFTPSRDTQREHEVQQPRFGDRDKEKTQLSGTQPGVSGTQQPLTHTQGERGKEVGGQGPVQGQGQQPVRRIEVQ